jgi:hypothetical protein
MVKSKDDINADMLVLRTSTDGLDDVYKVHGVLPVGRVDSPTCSMRSFARYWAKR